MAVNKFILIAILLGFVVSWVPRVLPFVLVKYKGLPDIVVRFLHYLPVSILFALILSSLTTEKIGHLPQFKWMEILATVPTVIVAFKSKNLLYAVIVGIISMALIRFVFQQMKRLGVALSESLSKSFLVIVKKGSNVVFTETNHWIYSCPIFFS